MCLCRLRPMLTQIIGEGQGTGDRDEGRTGCFTLNPLLSPTRAVGSNPLELAVQVLAGKDEGRGAAVGTVMLVLDQVPLGKEGVDFLGSQSVAEFDGRFAGDHMQ